MKASLILLTATLSSSWKEDISVSCIATWPKYFLAPAGSETLRVYAGNIGLRYGFFISYSAFIPLRFSVSNLSSSDGSFKLVAEVSQLDRKYLFERPLHLPGGQSRSFTLNIPRQQESGGGQVVVRLLEKGRPVLEKRFKLPFPQAQDGTLMMILGNFPHLPSLSGSYVTLWKSWPGMLSTSALPEALAYLIDENEIPPHSWYSYLGVPAVLVHRSIIGSLDPRQRAALWKYAACGGCLIIYGAKPGKLLPQRFAEIVEQRSRGKEEYSCPFMHGSIVVIPERKDSTIAEALNKTSSLWLGAIKECTQCQNLVTYISNENYRPTAFFKYVQQKRRATNVFGVLSLFVFCSIALVLTVVYWYKRPLLLLLCVPALSFAFILLLLVISFFSYGIVPKVSFSTYTELDPEIGMASTWSYIFFQAALPPREITLGQDRLLVSENPKKLRVKLNSTTQVQGLFGPLLFQTVQSAQVEPTQQALTLERKGTRLWIVNGFLTRIEKVFVFLDGKVYFASSLDPGAESELEERGSIKGDFSVRRLKPSKASEKVLLTHGPATLRLKLDGEGRFLAFCYRSPFFDFPLKSRVERQVHVISGWLRYAP